MTSIASLAEAFFEACETGKGWDACSRYCSSDATFSAQAEPLLEVKTLAEYVDWMKGIMAVFLGARYELKSSLRMWFGTMWPPMLSFMRLTQEMVGQFQRPASA